MKLNYTYWKDDDWLIGYLDDYPGWWTQGKSVEDLETMLLDLYDLCDDDESIKSAKNTDNMEPVPETVFHGILKIPLAIAV